MNRNIKRKSSHLLNLLEFKTMLEFNFNAVFLTAFVSATKGLKLPWKR